MKKRFAGILAGLLTLAILLTSADFSVFADEENGSAAEPTVQEESVQDNGKQRTGAVSSNTVPSARDEEEESEEPETVAQDIGAIEVLITAGIAVEKPQTFAVTLTGPNGKSQTGELQIDPQGEGVVAASQDRVRFSGLKRGDYRITVTGSGYIDYAQTINVNELGYRVQLYTGNVSGFDGGAHPGLLTYGDVNGDGKLNQADADAIVDAIEAGSEKDIYDLNKDGQVDLLDLNYFTEFLENHEPKSATVEKFVPAEAVKPATANDTVVQSGTLERMLGGGVDKETAVTLASAEGGAISEAHPVAVELTFLGKREMEEIIISSPQESERGMAAGMVKIQYEDENGKRRTMDVPFSASPGANIAAVSAFSGIGVASNGAVSVPRSAAVSWQGSELCINLNGQIAVKKVTIIITKTLGASASLAEITKVEFVNDMESRIAPPDMNIPENLVLTANNKSFTAKWDAQVNVTGYELAITHNGETEYRRTTATELTVTQFGGDKLENHERYTVQVQSVNGTWKSGYCPSITVIPKADKTPDAPDNVSVTGGYRSITVRWSAAKDADSYNLFYKAEGEETYQKITGIQGVYYVLNELEDSTKYMVYVTAVNEIGEGPASLVAADRTISGLTDAQLPAYRLINTSNGEGVLSDHIKSATIGGGGVMVDSPLDQRANSALGLFDNNYASYVDRKDWDYGGAYPSSDKGVFTEFDQTYEIGMIAFAEPLDIGVYTYLSVYYWNEDGERQRADGLTLMQKSDGARRYYLIKTKEPLVTSRIQIGVGRYGSTPWQVTISEIRFYSYDSLEHDILDLYGDDLHITLKPDVTAAQIEALQERLDTVDMASKEYHPERAALQKELDAAKALLETEGLDDVIAVDPSIGAYKDSAIGVGGLNAWQPLGVTAAAGEELVIYVGHPDMATGANTKLQLVFTQQHAGSSKLSATTSLKIGRNEITVPRISTTEQEKGGALYVQYNGSNEKDQYAVRVKGGHTYPVLNVYRVSEEERESRIQAYVQELRTYVAGLEETHGTLHGSGTGDSTDYAYDAQNCILNMTDIQTDHIMFSLPASQVLAGLGDGSAETVLSNTVQAANGMMVLFYQHKGLTDSFAVGTDSGVIAKNHLPYRYQNVRYMRMFAGAFMYAGGNHIGIQWNECRGMMGSVPVSADDSGRYQSGRYFGWGIAHEIGHEINQSAYAYAEVTNNYFSVLAQARDTNNSVRFQYGEVFKKVTSGTKGYASSVFTQLGMYWQLHLAYDPDYNYKLYKNYQELFENRFFARVDSYARDPASAPGGLTLSSDRDQKLMRLASAAAERDLTDFFTRWGMTPNEETKAYMGQFAPEERAIYYVDDEAHVYAMEHDEASQTLLGADVVRVQASAEGSVVTLSMTAQTDADALQGYEITRVYTEQGKERKEVAGFTREGTFTDQVPFAANRVITYEVTAIDKYMNRSRTVRSEAVKIAGDGLQDMAHWTVETNMISGQDTIPDAGNEDPCEKTTVSAAGLMADGDKATTFTGNAGDADPYILLKLGRLTQVEALRYTVAAGQPITDYLVEVSTDGAHFTRVKSGTFRMENGNETIYFENDQDPWVCTYDAAYVRLTAVGQQGKNLSVSELNLYGPSGDNVEFLQVQGGTQAGIGILEADYQYGKEEDERIPKDSIVFTGTYKGNPAYNVVVLYDEKGNIVGGIGSDGNMIAHQIILAPDPGDAMLGDTSEGTWIYWITPDTGITRATLPKTVRAELYRVDNALTNEGQRLVSDTRFVEIPETLSGIKLSGQ